MRIRLPYLPLHINHVLAISMIILLACVGCRRELEEEPETQVALIPISIDWSKSGLLEAKGQGIFHASVLFFPQDGGQPFVTILEGNHIYGDVISLPIGVYSILVFNEDTYDSPRIPGISFRGTNKWSTFEAYAGLMSKYSSKNRSKSDVLDKKVPPAALSAWSLERFEVTQDMVTITRTRALARSKGVPDESTSKSDSELNKLINIAPLPMTNNIEINAEVKNLTEAGAAVVTLSGATEGVFLSTGKRNFTRIAHSVGVPRTNWTYDTNTPADGTVHGNMLIFGLNKENIELVLDFVLVNGEAFADSPVFDVTNQVKDSEPDERTITVGVGDNPNTDPSKPPIDKPIVLPPNVTDGNVLVDEWGNVEISIK